MAARQRDLITRAQLSALGLGPAAIARRVADGALRRLWRGVYTVSQAPLSREAQWLAATLAWVRRRDEPLRRRDRARRVTLPLALIDVVSPRKRTLEGVRVHYIRTLQPDDVTTNRGIPTRASPAPLDFADVLTPFQLANVLHQARVQGHRRFMPQADGRHNAKTFTQAFELHHSGSAGTRSTAEDVFLTLGLPEPLVNVVYLGFEVDFRWPDRRVAVEVDGPHHGRRTTATPTSRATKPWSPTATSCCDSAPMRSSNAAPTSPSGCATRFPSDPRP